MKRKALKAAFPYTLPIFAGFWFLALAYGILMNVNGFSFVYPMFMSMLIYGGSLEFIAVSMLMSAFAPLTTLTVTLLVQARHLFYGITMLDRFKGMGVEKALSHLRHVRRNFFNQLYGGYSGRCGLRLVYVLCDPLESHLLGFRRNTRRPDRLSPKV